jgi:glyoxylase-like metal-dependent hydrolase (beta-lactamase superfamily II)
MLSEIAPGRYMIESQTDGRLLLNYLFTSSGQALLIDSGEAGTVEQSILPALATLDLAPERLTHIVITHPDVDHQGGAAQLAALAPDALIMCGFEDAPLVGDPDLMIQQRYRAYREHGIDYAPDQLAAIRAAAGEAIAVGGTLLGGETLQIGELTLRVHHGPGHSAGHLMIEDPRLGAWFMSDAVHGRFFSKLDGSPSLPPTYEDVDRYLATIAKLRAAAPRSLYSAHFRPLQGEAVEGFLDESVSFVEALDRFLLDRLSEGDLTLAELCDRAATHFGPYATPPWFLMFAVHGHLRRAGRAGVLTQRPGSGTVPQFTRSVC